MLWSRNLLPGSGQNPRTRSNIIQLKVSKLLPASCEEVFDMWLNPESMSRWMHAGSVVAAYVELNPVVGGTFRIDMQREDGRIFVHTGEYLAIERPHKLVFTWNSTVLGDHSSLVTVEFHEQAENC